MNRFALLLLSILLAGAAVRADEPAPEVSARNFVSLRFTNTNFLRPRSDSYTIRVRNRKISRTLTFPGRGDAKKPPQERNLSPGEWTRFLAELRLCVPAIAGRYFDKSVLDAPSQLLELTLLDASRHKRTFSISSTGNKAPPAFYKFKGYLNTLIQRKFAPSS